MASLTPAQRRVLEAAQRGDLWRVGGPLAKTIRERPEHGIGVRTVSGIAYGLIAGGLLTIGGTAEDSERGQFEPLPLTTAGRAELGITDTEED